jgi:hypothetical protein
MEASLRFWRKPQARSDGESNLEALAIFPEIRGSPLKLHEVIEPLLHGSLEVLAGVRSTSFL